MKILFWWLSLYLVMGSRGNTVMLEEFKALLEKSLTNKTDRYWLDQVGLEIMMRTIFVLLFHLIL